MNDQIMSELKRIDGTMQAMLQCMKNIESHSERLRSIENLLENIMSSDKHTEVLMEKSWKEYEKDSRRQQNNEQA